MWHFSRRMFFFVPCLCRRGSCLEFRRALTKHTTRRSNQCASRSAPSEFVSIVKDPSWTPIRFYRTKQNVSLQFEKQYNKCYGYVFISIEKFPSDGERNQKEPAEFRKKRWHQPNTRCSTRHRAAKLEFRALRCPISHLLLTLG